MKSLSVRRFHKRIGAVTMFELQEILAAVVLCVGYECSVCKVKEKE